MLNRFKKTILKFLIPTALAGGLVIATNDKTIPDTASIRGTKVENCRAWVYMTDGKQIEITPDDYNSLTRSVMTKKQKKADIEKDFSKRVGRKPEQFTLVYDNGDCITDLIINH